MGDMWINLNTIWGHDGLPTDATLLKWWKDVGWDSSRVISHISAVYETQYPERDIIDTRVPVVGILMDTSRVLDEYQEWYMDHAHELWIQPTGRGKIGYDKQSHISTLAAFVEWEMYLCDAIQYLQFVGSVEEMLRVIYTKELDTLD